MHLSSQQLKELFLQLVLKKMYTEVDRSQFPLVSPFLGASTYLSLYAIIDRKASGRTWVDNTSDPNGAFVWDLTNGFVFVLGKPDSSIDFREMNLFFKDELAPTARKSGYTKLNIIFLFNPTKARISEFLEDLSASTEDIYHFSLRGEDELKVPDIDIPQGSRLVMIDKDVLGNAKLVNIEEVRRCIMACWQELDRYLSEGTGFMLLKHKNVVSWCSTDYVVSGKCDLYVETFEAYRQKGFGTIVTSACVKECLNRKLETNWHCWHQNIASIRLAQKIGFLQRPNLTAHVVSL